MNGKYLLWLFGFLIGFAFGIHSAKAETTTYYNQYGQPQGSASTYGGTTNYYNQYGQPIGSASTYGGTTNYYNQYGQPQGSASSSGYAPQYNYNPQPTWNPYIQPRTK